MGWLLYRSAGHSLISSWNFWTRKTQGNKTNKPTKSALLFYGIVLWGWYGILWYGMVWYGMAWYGMVCHATLCYDMICYAMLCYAMLCYAMLCYAMLCYAMLCDAMPCYAMLCWAESLCCAVLCCVALCCAELSWAVLCCAAPCRAMPCRAVPCRAVLQYGMVWYDTAWKRGCIDACLEEQIKRAELHANSAPNLVVFLEEIEQHHLVECRTQSHFASGNIRRNGLRQKKAWRSKAETQEHRIIAGWCLRHNWIQSSHWLGGVWGGGGGGGIRERGNGERKGERKETIKGGTHVQ